MGKRKISVEDLKILYDKIEAEGLRYDQTIDFNGGEARVQNVISALCHCLKTGASHADDPCCYPGCLDYPC